MLLLEIRIISFCMSWACRVNSGNLGVWSMSILRVGNAPCSWGSLEFENTGAEPIGYRQMLDELAETGYTGTELGDWGYMPTGPAALRGELDARGLAMLGAFVPVALKNPRTHSKGIETAVRTARLLAAVAGDPKPYLVLADDNGTVPSRTLNAGRITPEMGLTASEWGFFKVGANAIGRIVAAETGLQTVFHHHCAGYVETPEEIVAQARRAVEIFGADRVLLTPDCGFATFADSPVASTRIAEDKLRAIARAAAVLSGRAPGQ
jgi:inosose dehydratase